MLEVAAGDPEAAPNGFFFDFVPFHTYSSPYKMLDVAATYRRALGKFGLARPLWLAETNVVPHDDPHARVPRASARGTLEEQASFVIQTVALARAAGVERVQFYKMMDGPIEAGEPYGLVRNDGGEAAPTPPPPSTTSTSVASHVPVLGVPPGLSLGTGDVQITLLWADANLNFYLRANSLQNQPQLLKHNKGNSLF